MASNSKNPPLIQRKIAVLGFRAVGKSSLTNSFVTGSFSEGYDPTIEATMSKLVRFRKVHFQCDIVDTAGMDEFSSLSRNASLGVHGYVLVFSITSRPSLETVSQVNDVLLNTLGDAPEELVPRVLVGSMKDMESIRQVSHEEASALARSMGVPYIECSAKTGENVADVFHTLLKEVEKDDGLLTEVGPNPCTIQ